jgi:hypothetical protein
MRLAENRQHAARLRIFTNEANRKLAACSPSHELNQGKIEEGWIGENRKDGGSCRSQPRGHQKNPCNMYTAKRGGEICTQK